MKRIFAILLTALLLTTSVFAWEISEDDGGWSKIYKGYTGFSDVSENDWFYNSVRYVYTNSYMNGMSEKIFSPNTSLTRGMLVTILYRIENSPETADLELIDTASSAWYAKGVYWAINNGVANGTGEKMFSPENAITREQLAVMLYNYCHMNKETSAETVPEATFADYDKVSSWAKTAVDWAYAEGVMSGKGENFDPQGGATRAEVATVLMRLLSK